MSQFDFGLALHQLLSLQVIILLLEVLYSGLQLPLHLLQLFSFLLKVPKSVGN